MKVCHYNMSVFVHFITPSKFGGNSHNLTCFPAVAMVRHHVSPESKSHRARKETISTCDRRCVCRHPLWAQSRIPDKTGRQPVIGIGRVPWRWKLCKMLNGHPLHMHIHGELPSRLLKLPNYGTCVASSSRPPRNQQAQYVNWIRHETHSESVFDCFLHTRQLAKDTQLRHSYTCVTVPRWPEYGLSYCSGFPAPREAASRCFCLSAIQAPP